MDAISNRTNKKPKQPKSVASSLLKRSPGKDAARHERLVARGMRRHAEMLRLEEAAKTRQNLKRLFDLGPEEAAKELDQHCEHCQRLLVPRFQTPEVLGRMRYLTIWPDCNCQQSQDHEARLKREAREAEQKAQAQLYEATLTRCGLVGWLKSATFTNYHSRDDWDGVAHCKQQAMAYAQALIDGELHNQEIEVAGLQTIEEIIQKKYEPRCNWLIMYGGYGLGKSHLGAAIVRAAIDAGMRNVYFRVWPEYLKRLQATWGKSSHEENEAEVIRELQQGDFVVIDDLDKRQPSEWVQGTLYLVVNYRYNRNLPTALTFNCSLEEQSEKTPGRLALEDYLSKPVVDRLTDRAFDVIEFTGPSYRSGIEWQQQP